MSEGGIAELEDELARVLCFACGAEMSEVHTLLGGIKGVEYICLFAHCDNKLGAQ